MEPKIREAFDQIHADDRLKESTKAFIAQEMAKRQKKHMSFQWRAVYAAAACLVVCLAVIGGYRWYFTPTSIISIDINPSIELNINRFNKVIGVHGYNEDGVDFAESLDVLYMDYNQAVDEILESETITQCLARNELLSVGVVEINEAQGEAILEYVSQCTADQQNTYCYGVNSEEVAQAHSLGLSYGKYMVYVEIQAYTTEITPEQANQMTMRELRDLLAQLQSANGESSDTQENSTQHGNSYGPGNGNGSGNSAGTGNGMGSGNGAGAGNGKGSGNGTGSGSGSGAGNGTGSGSGSGAGNSTGSGSGSGAGNGTGSGSGSGAGNGTGSGNGSGAGNGMGFGNGAGNGKGAGYGGKKGNGGS